MKMLVKAAAAACAFAALAPAAMAGAFGFETRLSQAQNLDGKDVPQIEVIIDRGRRSLDRAPLERALRSRLSEIGVRPDVVEVQSVATAAMQLSQAQDLGSQQNCYERWCALVTVAGSDY